MKIGEASRISGKAQPVNVSIRVIAIAAISPRRRRDEANLFIVADHPLGHSANARCLTNLHILALLSRSALVTTLTDESDIAAAAIIGESRRPNAG